MESQSLGGKFKKKKKMSYMQKMRKFGKSGRFGQGRQVDKETYDYFLRVMEANRQGCAQVPLCILEQSSFLIGI